VDSGSSTPSNECLDVFADAETGIFDETGTRVDLSSVVSGDRLTAIGFLSIYDDADGDTHMDDLRLDAAVVELGDQGTFERIVGSVVSAPGNNDLFVLDRRRSTTRPTRSTYGCGRYRILRSAATRIDPAALQPARQAK
jgi:hypothetical protein